MFMNKAQTMMAIRGEKKGIDHKTTNLLYYYTIRILAIETLPHAKHWRVVFLHEAWVQN